MADPRGDLVQYHVVDDVTRRSTVERRRLGHGWLGNIFGELTNAPTNIAGFVVTLFTIITVALAFAPPNLPAMDFLNIVLPVITLTLGYLCW